MATTPSSPPAAQADESIDIQSHTAHSQRGSETVRDDEHPTRDEGHKTSSVDEPDVPPEPYSYFSRTQIAFIVALASWSASFSGLSSNIYFPSISVIADDLNVTSELVNVTVTLYLIFQGLSPSLWAPLSDLKGRRVVILVTFALYIGANVGLALTRNYAQLAVLRAVQSSGSASSVAIGAAIVGDVADKADRAGYMGIFGGASLLATALGPLIGGAIAESVGWRNIFWLLVAYAGTFLVLATALMPETMRKIVGNGRIVPSSRLARVPTYGIWVARQDRVKLTDEERTLAKTAAHFSAAHVLQPVLLLRHPGVLCSVLYLSLHYAVWQMSITVSSTFFARLYGLNQLQVGLTFLANGFGCLVGTIGAGRLLDVHYRAIVRSHQRDLDEGHRRRFPLARARLALVWTFSAAEFGGLLLLGWTVDRHVHIAAPIVASIFISAAVMSTHTAVSTFLTDSYPAQAASVNATLNLGRCLLAAAGTSAILPMTNGMGIGWAFTLLCFILLLANALVVWQLYAEKRSQDDEGADLPASSASSSS